jgi:S-adenosylmethionine decarboxylase
MTPQPTASSTARAAAPAGAAGRHLLADLHGVRPGLLTDEGRLTSVLRRALDGAGFHVLAVCGHTFTGGGEGVTVMMLLSESHASIHTYPEHGYAALDVFSCGGARPEEALESVVAALEPESVSTSLQPRGTARP